MVSEIVRFGLVFVLASSVLLQVRMVYSVVTFVACGILTVVFSFDPNNTLLNGIFTGSAFVWGRKIMQYLVLISGSDPVKRPVKK